MSSISYRRGAVSIFVVIFTALLITIVTVSFVRLMVREQQRASDNDLSQSAYDSALVGVEDAKRALARYYAMNESDRPDASALEKCNVITPLLAGSTVTSSTPPQPEVRVETSASDSSLNQGYTCVKVRIQTDHYKRSAKADETRLIPLKGVGTFNTVRIEWFSQKDISSGTPITIPPSATPSELSQTWPTGRPPVLETQLIQTNQNFHVDQFDAAAGEKSNANTLFLYPKALGSDPTLAFGDDTRRTPKSGVTDIRCRTSFSSAVEYLCSATIQLPEPIGGTHANRTNTYLRIVPRYKSANIQVTLYNGSNPVLLNGVQPLVDSTGRANDLFRRVEAYVEAGANTVYPEAAVDVSGNFCKTFSVTDRAGDYTRGSGADPCIP